MTRNTTDSDQHKAKVTEGGTPASLMAMGRTLQSQGRSAEAAACFRRVSELSDATSHDINLAGNLLLELGDARGAEGCYRKAVARDSGVVESHCNLGFARVIIGDLEGSVTAYNEALRLFPDHHDALAGLAAALERQGDYDRSYALVTSVISTSPAHPHAVLTFAYLSHRFNRERDAVTLLRQLLDRPDVTTQYRVQVFFALGKLLDSLGDYDAAFHNYREGNALKRYPYDRHQHQAAIEQLQSAFSPAFMAHAPRAANRSEVPIFIVGMPRSGTSLVEQILASHPEIHGAGELENITQLANELFHGVGGGISYPQCVNNASQSLLDKLSRQHLAYLNTVSPGAARVTDKLPGNIYNLGLIDLLFPGARVIHVMRDPLDTCLSCYFQNFVVGHYYSYDLAHVGAYYRNYLRMMAHWRRVIRIPILEVRYEDLVADLENVSRKLIGFCGLDWSAQCLRFSDNTRSVATASYEQVRQPIYTRSVGRWRHYDRYLGPLRDALGIAADGQRGDFP
jgi:tetratricopeptide (TPR) repeat protein